MLKYLNVTAYLMLLFILFTPACKKSNNDKGVVTCNFKYSGKDTFPPQVQMAGGEHYVGHGDFIKAITPTVFKAKFSYIRFQSDWENSPLTMELIENNTAFEAPERYADFSQGNEVKLNPKVWYTNTSGNAIDEMQVDLRYLYYSLFYYYQEVALPNEYANIQLDQFQTIFNYTIDKGDTAQKGLLLKSDHYPFIDRLFGTPPGGLPSVYVFGNTDSTFVFNIEGNLVGPSKDNPTSGNIQSPIIRSNHYQTTSFLYSETKSLNINATIIFDYDGMIEIYAGRDNIPYTKDDIFLYAPKFWERLKVNVTAQ